MAQFDSLIGNYLAGITQHEIDSMIQARVVAVDKEHVLVDLGDKAEGMIEIQEFTDFKGNISVTVGETVDVLVQGRDEESGLIIVSHRKARHQSAWRC